MKDKNLRICKAAIGRVLIELIDRAGECSWSAEQLGATIRAIRHYISDDGRVSDSHIADSDLYRATCDQIDRSESRSRKARERWARKKLEESPDAVVPESSIFEETSDNSLETIVDAEDESAENNDVQTVSWSVDRIIPPATSWEETVTMLKGIADIPTHRPLYPNDIPEPLRVYGIESYQEYVRSRYYADGLRGDELEFKVSDAVMRREMRMAERMRRMMVLDSDDC